MSSILRALKKLESEPRHLEETRPLDCKFVPLADTSPQKTATGLLMMVIGGGIVCGLVVLAGWWLFSEKTQLAPVVRQSLPQAEMVVPQKTAAHPPGPTPAKVPQPSPPAIESKAVIPVVEQAAESALQMPAAPNPQIIAQVPAKNVAADSTRAPAIPTKTKTIAIPVLSDPEIKLQAITWSKDPQKRIAVINNRILRQGEVVSGYRIDIINQDDIVLSEGGKKWKLIFRSN